MSNMIDLGKASDLNDGAMRQVTVQGREILLAGVGNQYYAQEDRILMETR